jgi:hypothetical protein
VRMAGSPERAVDTPATVVGAAVEEALWQL